jgi:hypothetical protein
MPNTSWWEKADAEQKELAVRVANKEAFSLGSVRLPAISNWERYTRRLLTGSDLGEFRKSERRADQPLREVREQLATIIKWQNGAALPSDVRKCKYQRCARFFLVRQSRANRVFHSAECKRNCLSLTLMNARNHAIREKKLQRIISAMEEFENQPDWKLRTARKARVTANFITYAIRRGEIAPH